MHRTRSVSRQINQVLADKLTTNRRRSWVRGGGGGQRENWPLVSGRVKEANSTLPMLQRTDSKKCRSPNKQKFLAFRPRVLSKTGVEPRIEYCSFVLVTESGRLIGLEKRKKTDLYRVPRRQAEASWLRNRKDNLTRSGQPPAAGRDAETGLDMAQGTFFFRIQPTPLGQVLRAYVHT